MGSGPSTRATDVLVEVRLDGDRTVVTLPLVEMRDVDLSAVLPIHESPAWRGRRDYEGSWWFSGLRRNIAFSTLGERDLLMVLDAGQDVVSVAPRPLTLKRRSAGASEHVTPGFYARFSDGREILTHRTAASSELRRRVEEATGLALTCWTPDDGTLLNLRWLAGFRHTRWRLPADQEERIRRVFGRPTALLSGVQRAARVCDLPFDITLGGIYSMLWRGELAVPLTGSPISDASIVRAA